MARSRTCTHSCEALIEPAAVVDARRADGACAADGGMHQPVTALEAAHVAVHRTAASFFSIQNTGMVWSLVLAMALVRR